MMLFNRLDLFFDLLKVTVGAQRELSRCYTEKEWNGTLYEAERQAIAGVMVDGLERLPDKQRPPQDIILQWIGETQIMEQTYKIQCKRALALSKIFRVSGYNSCVLKGIGNAQYYPNPQRRQCGDIDVWVDGDRDKVIGHLLKKGPIRHIDIKHCDWDVFQDVPVEVHFIPTWFYNPFVNRRLQRWFKAQKGVQFEHKNEIEINTPTTAFNLVYVLIHIYRHLFDSGVGIRQFVDYYYILEHSSKEERFDAMQVLSSLRMKQFVGATMYVLQDVFNMDDNFLLSEPLKGDGQFLLSEIMRAGNFGHYDDRNKHYQSRWANGLQSVKRNIRFVWRYPQEVCWMPTWKVWHWCWRKRKGYLLIQSLN